MVVGTFVRLEDIQQDLHRIIDRKDSLTCEKYLGQPALLSLWREGVCDCARATLDYLSVCRNYTGIAEWKG